MDERTKPNPTQSKPPDIHSPADLANLVARTSIHTEPDASDGYKSSTSETESSDETSDSDEEEINSAETPSHLTMDGQLLNGLQDQIAQLQTQLQQQRLQQQKTTRALEKAPIPDSSATQRPAPFHGYDSEDVVRWLNKIESYLKLRRIDPATPTALAELSLNLAGPAEDFYYSLPEDHKTTFNQLRDALRERFANDNQSWLIWQSVTTRQQGTLEPLDTYLSDLTNKFRRLNITDAEKMRYFVQGLRADVRKTVFLRQPTTFREAEEIARLACSVENTMSSAPVSHMAAQLNQLSQTVNSLATVQNTSNLVPPMKISEDEKIVSLLEHNNAVLAEVRSKLENSPTSQVPISTSTTRLNGPQAVAALHDTSNVSSDNTNRARSEIQQLKEMIQNLGREMDARIRGLARQNQGTRFEIPRKRTRDGRPVCFTCGRVGHLQTSCPERGNLPAQVTPQQPQQSHRPNYSPNLNYNQPRDNYRNYSQTNRRDQRLAVLDDDLYDEEFVGHLAPGNPEQMYFARRSTPHQRENNVISAIKPSRRQRMVRCPTNLHEKVTPQHAVMLPGNQKSKQAKPSATVAVEKFPAPRDNQATPEPVTDQGYDTSDVPVEFKPAFDLFLRAIKRHSQETAATEHKSLSPQIMNIPNATTAQPINSEVKDCSEKISSDLDQTSVSRKTLEIQDCTSNKVMPAQDESSTEQVCPSTATSSSEKVQQRLPHSDASLHYSDLTTSGVIAGEAVQLLVDTGACLSVIDERVLQKIYGPFSPKMSDGFLPSIQTVNGERVPVLGKITVPIKLNGREFVCDFHVMQNLPYDAILGRDFLQQNRALIDLDNNNITFKRSKDAKKTGKRTSRLPVLGTFLSPTTSVERQTSTETDLQPHPKISSPKKVQESQNGNKRVPHYSLLVWVCFVLHLLTASPTVMQESNKPVVQTIQRSCIIFHDAINENADRDNAGASVHTFDQPNHKEPYKVTRGKRESPKSHRVSFKTTQTATEILTDCKYTVPKSVRIQEENTVRDLVHASLISVALNLPKVELKIKTKAQL